MQIPDEVATRIMDAAQRFQRKLTRMASQSATDDGRDSINQEDVDIALVLLLSKDTTNNWTDG